MSDPASGAEEAFRTFATKVHAESNGSTDDLQRIWDRFQFVDDITPHLPDVEFVQEVTLISNPITQSTLVLLQDQCTDLRLATERSRAPRTQATHRGIN